MTGLFFGSFNPLHNGHIKIATYILDNELCDKILFIISPQNPFKQDCFLLDEEKRKEIVEKAIQADKRMQVSDIEFYLPKPSYTTDTLKKLSTLYPCEPFALIIGADNLRDFHLWKDYRNIASCHKIIVYPRPGIDTSSIFYPNVVNIDAPLSDISSTEIRQKIENGENISNFVPASVSRLIIQYYLPSGQ